MLRLNLECPECDYEYQYWIGKFGPNTIVCPICKTRYKLIFEKDEHAKLLERYEELLFAQRAGKLALGEEEELAQLESDLGALMPEWPGWTSRQKYEQDMAFFADLLRKRLEEE